MCSWKTVEQRSSQLSLLHHPDKIQHSHGKDKAAATEQYLAIKAAYEVLKKHRQPETTSGSDDGSYTEPQKERNDDAHPNQNSFRVIAPWFYGLFGIGALVSVLGASVSAQRAKATKEAWDRYTQQRAEEGLGRALGYEEDEEVLREVKGQEESHILFRALRSHSVSKTVGKHVLEEPGRGD